MGETRHRANREWDLSIRVLQHTDGRSVVYGVYDYDTQFRGDRGAMIKVGRLYGAGQDLAAAIAEIGDLMIDRFADAEGNAAEGRCHVRAVVAECIADLPAETLR